MKVLRGLLVGILTFFVMFCVALEYGIGVEPRLILDKEKKSAEIPDLPSSWEGEQVAVFGDFQLGMFWDNEGMVQKAVNTILEERPAVVLITGDYIYHASQDPRMDIERVVKKLRPLVESGIPVYGVLGNHDYSMKHPDDKPDQELAMRVYHALDNLGVHMMQNTAVPLPPPKGKEVPAGEASLYLVGIGARWPDMADPSKALGQVPHGAPRLALMHHPDTFARLPPHAALLAVAGHTHGGQIRIPFTPSWSWLAYYRQDRVHADGWVKEGYGAPGNSLYVNRGIGFSVLPIRINCPPELTIFTLHRPK